MTAWRITADGDGYDVRQGRSRRTQRFDDMDAVLRFIRPRFHLGDRVVLVETDGYQTVITRQVARRGWRA